MKNNFTHNQPRRKFHYRRNCDNSPNYKISVNRLPLPKQMTCSPSTIVALELWNSSVKPPPQMNSPVITRNLVLQRVRGTPVYSLVMQICGLNEKLSKGNSRRNS